MKLLLSALAVAAVLSAADTRLGGPLKLKEPVALATLYANAGDYAGKTVQVKGKIVQVCQMMGCWMDLANDDGQKIHIKVDDGVIVFPKDAAGRIATVEGKFTKIELTREQAVERAKEEAADSGRKFDPDEVKSGVTIYEIAGAGAVIQSRGE